MELRQIKDLMAAMRRHGMNRLKYEDDQCKLELEHHDGSVVREVVAPVAIPASNPLPGAAQTAIAEEEPAGDFVTSPIVGTFYSSATPDSPTFVKPGDRVSENSVVCIIEAMKVMNEIKAGVSGTLEEVLVENAHPVEFGTKLFRVV